MPEELELGAVPANDPAYGDAVSDREFDSWVRRSQGETDAVLAAWDESVAFDQEIRIAAPAPFDQDIDANILDPIHEEFTQPMAPIGRDTISTLSERTLQHARELQPPAGYLLDVMRFMGYAQEARLSPLAERLAELRRCQVARQNLEREGFVIVDCDTRPRASGLILPSDDAVAWAKREFRVPTQRETHGTDNVTLTPFSYEGFRVGDVARRAVVSGIQ